MPAFSSDVSHILSLICLSFAFRKGMFLINHHKKVAFWANSMCSKPTSGWSFCRASGHANPEDLSQAIERAANEQLQPWRVINESLMLACFLAWFMNSFIDRFWLFGWLIDGWIDALMHWFIDVVWWWLLMITSVFSIGLNLRSDQHSVSLRRHINKKRLGFVCST